jgi:hypothetical protein
VLVWDPAEPGAAPAELGRAGEGGVRAAVALPDGRVVTADGEFRFGGRVLVWDRVTPAIEDVSTPSVAVSWSYAALLAVSMRAAMAG